MYAHFTSKFILSLSRKIVRWIDRKIDRDRDMSMGPCQYLVPLPTPVGLNLEVLAWTHAQSNFFPFHICSSLLWQWECWLPFSLIHFITSPVWTNLPSPSLLFPFADVLLSFHGLWLLNQGFCFCIDPLLTSLDSYSPLPGHVTARMPLLTCSGLAPHSSCPSTKTTGKSTGQRDTAQALCISDTD